VPAPSAFLPAGFNPQRPITLIAGQGVYPQLVAAAIRQAKIPLRLVAFEEETPPELIASFPESERRVLLVGQLGKMLRSLEDFDAGYALMAGQTSRRRKSSSRSSAATPRPSSAPSPRKSPRSASRCSMRGRSSMTSSPPPAS